MWYTRDDEDKQRELEKLIDWELRRQFIWALVFVASILGLLVLFASGFLSGWYVLYSSLLVKFNPVKVPFVVIYLVLMLFGVDVSFYRLTASLADLITWTEMLPSRLLHQELVDKGVLTWLSGLFVKRVNGEYSHRAWFVWVLIVLGDSLLVWALVSV